MAGKSTSQSDKKLLATYPWYHFVCMYYFSFNAFMAMSIVYHLAVIENFGGIFNGLLLFKFLFCLSAAVLLYKVAIHRINNTLGQGYVYLCGMYFFMFTVGVYILIGKKAWNSTSTDEIEAVLDIFSIVDDLLWEVNIPMWRVGYATSYVFLAPLVMPTPILGPYMVKAMYDEYTNPTIVLNDTYYKENPIYLDARKSKKIGKKRKRN